MTLMVWGISTSAASVLLPVALRVATMPSTGPQAFSWACWALIRVAPNCTEPSPEIACTDQPPADCIATRPLPANNCSNPGPVA